MCELVAGADDEVGERVAGYETAAASCAPRRFLRQWLPPPLRTGKQLSLRVGVRSENDSAEFWPDDFTQAFQQRAVVVVGDPIDEELVRQLEECPGLVHAEKKRWPEPGLEILATDLLA